MWPDNNGMCIDRQPVTDNRYADGGLEPLCCSVAVQLSCNEARCKRKTRSQQACEKWSAEVVLLIEEHSLPKRIHEVLL